MTFFESIKTVFTKYAEFNGKASLSEFWWWALFTVLVSSALNVFDVLTVGNNSSIGSILNGLWGIAILLPSLAVTIRRLRDAGYKWQNIFWVLLPVVGWVIVLVYCVRSTKKR